MDESAQVGRLVHRSSAGGGATKEREGANNADVLANGFQGYKRGYESLQRVRNFLGETIAPLLLMLFMPNAVMLLWFTAVKCQGSYLAMLQHLSRLGLYNGLCDVWSHVTLSWEIPCILIGYSLYALVMMKLLPGKTVYGPITPKGNIPVYKDNGFLFFVVTLVLFTVLTVALRSVGLSPTIIYDRFEEVLALLNIFSLIFCIFLYVKGILAPSSSDCGSSGNPVFDYYWGTELYPRVLGFDVKVFTNCRFGMMVWALLVTIFALKSYELYGFVDSAWVSAALQVIYLAKFFWWEAGYMSTIDIMLDRAGFYICWGCLVYVPSLYTSVSLYHVTNPMRLGTPLALFIFTAGLLCIFINYQADQQKHSVRSADGKCLVWGQQPSLIRARYQLESGETKESILLASGWWGVSRHFHYVPEILLAFCWTLPALFRNLMPYSYVIFLVILLTHRSYRDDEKCYKKYGRFWHEYCQQVPHRIIPYLF